MHLYLVILEGLKSLKGIQGDHCACPKIIEHGLLWSFSDTIHRNKTIFGDSKIYGGEWPCQLQLLACMEIEVLEALGVTCLLGMIAKEALKVKCLWCEVFIG